MDTLGLNNTLYQDVLGRVGVDTESMSITGRRYVTILSQLASQLHIVDTSISCYYAAISKLMIDANAAQEDEKRSGTLLRDLRGLLEVEERNRDNLAKLKEMAEGQFTAIMTSKDKSVNPAILQNDIEALRVKRLQYVQQVKSYEEHLASLGLSTAIEHESLVDTAKQLEAIKKRLIPLRQRLRSFSDLPPDLSLAAIKVEAARGKLARLNDLFDATVDAAI